MIEPKHVRIVDGVPCITLTEHEHLVNKLRELLAGCQAREDHYRATLEMFLMPMPDKSTTVMDLLLAVTESAMEALALPQDNTALKKALRTEYLRAMEGYYESIVQAKREVLLEAANIISQAVGQPGNDWGEGYTAATEDISKGLRRISEGLK
jgi:hypothetical protein